MAPNYFTQSRGISWLNLGENRLNQPLERSAAVGRTDPSLPGPAGLARGVLPGRTKTSFVLAQNRAVERATMQARSVLSAVGAVNIPAGDQISLIKSAQPSDGSFWTGRAESRATETTYLTRVLNLAQSRTSRSKALEETGQSDIAAGTYTLKLTEGEAEPVEFDFTVSYAEPFGDNNRLILERLATSLEQFGPTLAARVVEGAKFDANGFAVPTVALEIRSRHTGPVDDYRIEDVSGNLAESLDLEGLRRGGLDLTFLMGTQWATPYEVKTSDFNRSQPAPTLEPRVDWVPPQTDPQINRSITLNPLGNTDLPSGRYRFRVDQGGESRELVLNVDYYGFFPDNNTTILSDLAGALEEAAPGLRAEVRIGEALDQDDQSAMGATLYLSTAQGDDREFTLKDIENGLIHRLGLDRVYRPREVEPRAAANGLSQNFSDRFDLDETRLDTQVLRPFMDEPRKLTVSPAREPVIDQIRNVARQHNSLMAVLMEVEPYLGRTVQGNLTRDLLFNRKTYSEIGLEVSPSGFIGVGERFGEGLERDLAQTREGLFGKAGLLTVIERNMSSALSQGFNAHRNTRPGLIANDPPGTMNSGFDPYAGSVLGNVLVGGDGLGMDENEWILSRMA